MQNLRREIAASLPASLALPEEFGAALDWIDSVGASGRTKHGDTPYGVLDPAYVAGQGSSCIGFLPRDREHAGYWLGNHDNAVTDRLAPIVRTGGDGSYAALWLDDDGAQQIVHMGSGSGSLLTGVMVRTPIDFLRLLAVGYDELCWTEVFNLTPEQAAEQAGYEPGEWLPPTRFQEWVTTTFNVAIPATANDVVLPPSNMDTPSDDPFSRWTYRVRG